MRTYDLHLGMKMGDVMIQRVYTERIDAVTDAEAILMAEDSLAHAPAWECSNYAVLRDENGDIVWSKAFSERH